MLLAPRSELTKDSFHRRDFFRHHSDRVEGVGVRDQAVSEDEPGRGRGQTRSHPASATGCLEGRITLVTDLEIRPYDGLRPTIPQ